MRWRNNGGNWYERCERTSGPAVVQTDAPHDHHACVWLVYVPEVRSSAQESIRMSLYAGIELPNRPDPANILKLDLLPIPMVRSMMRYGQAIDADHFRALSSRLQARMVSLRRDITDQIPPQALDRFVELAGLDDDVSYDSEGDEIIDDTQQLNVDSGNKIAELLYDVLGLHRGGAVKVKKTKGGGTLSTGKKTLEQLKRDHPVVQLILDYREASKLDGTYARTMPRHARFHPKGKDCPLCGWHHRTDELRVHATILMTRTTTGRTAHKNPNLANIPTRSKLGRDIRAGFVASEGCLIADEDLSQIELRILADQSGDEVMLQVYRDDGDIHTKTGSEAFGLRPDQLDPLIHRIPSKTANFSIVYGTSEMGLFDQLCGSFGSMGMAQPDWLSEKWCRWFIDRWFVTYPGAKRYLDYLESMARRYAITWTPCGRVRRIPEVRSTHQWIQSAGVRQGANVPIQGFSADLMKLIMGEVWERLCRLDREYGIKTRPLNSIYDALMIEADEDDAEAVRCMIGEVMENVLVDRQTGRSHCKVPVKSEGHCSKRWEK